MSDIPLFRAKCQEMSRGAPRSENYIPPWVRVPPLEEKNSAAHTAFILKFTNNINHLLAFIQLPNLTLLHAGFGGGGGGENLGGKFDNFLCFFF